MNNSLGKILITGGAGFIGSHMIAFLLEKKVNFFVIDNLSNSNLNNIKILENHFNAIVPLKVIDLRDEHKLEQVFKNNNFSAVIHFAGLKSVSESVANPEKYFSNNIDGTKTLIKFIKKSKIKKVIFSSSATVYGFPNYLPLDENHVVKPINPYGFSKAIAEKLFMDDEFFKNISVKLLRYFNPIGSYKGIIGENFLDTPNNLMPYILGVANGTYDHLRIFGDDYDTQDGTGVRDFIHIMDLIDAHWHSLLDDKIGCDIYNVGTGVGYSVKNIVDTFEDVHSLKIPYKIYARRDGDIPVCYADVKKIKLFLNWQSKYKLKDICRDAWII